MAHSSADMVCSTYSTRIKGCLMVLVRLTASQKPFQQQHRKPAHSAGAGARSTPGMVSKSPGLDVVGAQQHTGNGSAELGPRSPARQAGMSARRVQLHPVQHLQQTRRQQTSCQSRRLSSC